MSEERASCMQQAGQDGNPPGDGWDAARVRSLRGHLGDTKREFAQRLGARQQTVSEWETGSSNPRGMARRLLHMVAEERCFYSTERDAEDGAAPAAG